MTFTGISDIFTTLRIGITHCGSLFEIIRSYCVERFENEIVQTADNGMNRGLEKFLVWLRGVISVV